jgi:hypothetical protein
MAKPVTLREVAREGRECRQPRSHVTRMARSNGIVTFAQYRRHFFGQFQAGYLTHRLLILLV